MTTPLELAGSLGLLGAGGPLGADRLAELERRERGFDWAHLGHTDLPVGRLLSVLESDEDLLPPRTGHLGNWEDIARGRAGAMDFNKAIAGRALGYPLIYCFNRTEDAALEAGDWVYLPGSIVRDGVRTELPLFSWDGAGFVSRTREHPLFVPFVLGEIDGERVPLIQLHWARMRRHPEFRFVLEAAVIHEHRAFVREVLHILVDDALASRNPHAALQDVVSDQVRLDGRSQRAHLRVSGSGFRMGDLHYETTDALVDACMLPFQAAVEPETFFAEIHRWPAAIPRIGNTLATLLTGLLSTDYLGNDRVTKPFRPHLQWGARDMAGYPPKRPGYFSRSANTKSATRMCTALIRHLDDVDPLYFVVLPAAIFMLCPTTAHPRDLAPVSELLERVRATDDAEGVVREWLPTARAEVSSYFLQRFYAHRSVHHTGDVPSESEPVEPPPFRDLTVRQACAVVGALVDAFEVSP